MLQFGLVGTAPKDRWSSSGSGNGRYRRFGPQSAYEIASQRGRPCILTELAPGMDRLATYLDIEPARARPHELPRRSHAPGYSRDPA